LFGLRFNEKFDMATTRNRKKNEKKEHSRWSNEVLGIALIGGGLLLLLALISFSPQDLTRLPFLGDAVETVENDPGSVNWVGPVGVFLGYCLLWLFGAAAYLVSLTMIWMGVAKVLFKARPSWRTWTGCGVFVVSGASLLAVQTLFLQHWAEVNHLQGAGGGVGYAFGTKFLEALFNKPGALLVLSSVYLVSLILLTGLHPMQFFRAISSVVKKWWSGRKDKKLSLAEKLAAREANRKRLDQKTPLFDDSELQPQVDPPKKRRRKPATKKAIPTIGRYSNKPPSFDITAVLLRSQINPVININPEIARPKFIASKMPPSKPFRLKVNRPIVNIPV